MKALKSQKGGAIVMALMATIGLIVVTMVVIEKSRQMKVNSARDAADKDVEMAATQISTILSSPADCNANFAGQPSSGTLSILRSCKTGTCRPYDITNTNAVYTSVPKTTTTEDSWKQAATGFIGGKVRINQMTYNIAVPQLGGTPPTAAQVELTVYFEKVSAITADYSIPSAPVMIRRTRRFQKVFRFPAAAPAGTIIGCAKSPNSTLPY